MCNGTCQVTPSLHIRLPNKCTINFYNSFYRVSIIAVLPFITLLPFCSCVFHCSSFPVSSSTLHLLAVVFNFPFPFLLYHLTLLLLLLVSILLLNFSIHSSVLSASINNTATLVFVFVCNQTALRNCSLIYILYNLMSS